MTGTNSTEDRLREALRLTVRDVPVDGDLYEKVAEGARRRARHRVALTGVAAAAVIIAGAVTAVVVADRRTEQPAAANTTCPQDLGSWTRGPQRPGTADVFVPDTPTSATLCRYDRPSGIGQEEPFTFSRRGELSGTDLRDLVTAFNAASEHPWRCPAQHHLVEVMVRFHYETGPDVDVTMSADACFASTNGARSATTNLVNIAGFTDKPPVTPDGSTTASR